MRKGVKRDGRMGIREFCSVLLPPPARRGETASVNINEVSKFRKKNLSVINEY